MALSQSKILAGLAVLVAVCAVSYALANSRLTVFVPFGQRTVLCVLLAVLVAVLCKFAAVVAAAVIVLVLVSLRHLVCILLGNDHRLRDCHAVRLAWTALWGPRT